MTASRTVACLGLAHLTMQAMVGDPVTKFVVLICSQLCCFIAAMSAPDL